ncbi:MAG: S46 family peptidase [Bacteroidetes bacterium]|nr:S46 family peptidase [Bacteroidota bacterium]
MQNIRSLLFAFILLYSFSGYADEGMWMPNQLKKKEVAMRSLGLQIPVEEIYSEENISLKDAIVQFGGGCSGEIISNAGLVLTNHHCGYSQVQSLSTMEHNYVKDGFWAMNKSQELPCPGLTVTFIISIQDVTEKVFSELKAEMTSDEKEHKLAEAIIAIEKQAAKEKWQQAKVKPFYYGNEYYLYITETFRDIRLVGIPPASLGRFGGDNENWVWPRHTADFSMFRIYADSINRPASYSDKNQPYKPKKSFTLCAKGIHEGDFAMVYGFPGRTAEYIPSFAVELIQNINDPSKVLIRDKRLSIWRERMNSNDTIQLEYSSKYGSLANYWKKWKGEMTGLRRGNVIEEKQQYEGKFTDWIGKDTNRRNEYSGVLHEMELFYSQIRPLSKLYDYYNEGILGIELITFINNNIRPLEGFAAVDSVPDDSLRSAASRLMKGIPGFFKNYDTKADEMILASMLRLYHDSIETKYHPGIYSLICGKYKGNYEKYARDVFRKSIFTDEQKQTLFLKTFSHGSLKKIRRDPAYMISRSFADMMKSMAADEMKRFNTRLASLQARYMKAQMEMNDPANMYPDANSTLRVAYGQVKGYHPMNAVYYDYFTSFSGIFEKYVPGDTDYDIPSKLIELYNSKNLGSYSSNGDVPFGFITSSHTTGGNSGSAVINAKGELIGTNFDRVWEGTMSDIKYNPEICRNISLDIRFTLFIIEKLGGAQNIIDELQISK